MKPQDVATLGVRLIGFAAMAWGLIIGAGFWTFQTMANSAPPVTTTSMHDTSYTIVHYHFQSVFEMCVLSVLLGLVFILMSRGIGRMLARGIPHGVA